MSLIPLHTKETAPEQSKPILERYEKNIGMIPNLFRLPAHSPEALKGVADLHAGLGRSFGARTRERIHIMTAEVNGCDYCLTTHTYLAGKFTKLTPEDIVAEIAFSFTTNLFDNTFKTDFDTGFRVLHTHYNELEGAAK